jgi:hypothetical protein
MLPLVRQGTFLSGDRHVLSSATTRIYLPAGLVTVNAGSLGGKSQAVISVVGHLVPAPPAP